MEVVRNNYDLLDAVKLVLSVSIFAMHSDLLPIGCFPWIRVAVPLFFMISSFLFFKKLSTTPKVNHNRVLLQYIRRNIVLYIAWSIILFPITFYWHRTWFENGFWSSLIKLTVQFLFGDTFLASWFIIANICSVCIIYFISPKIKTFILITLTCLLYFFCCLYSGYTDMIFPIERIKQAIVSVLDGGPEFSFLAGLIWTALGKLYAENKILPPRVALLGTVISGVLLYCEYAISTTFLHTNGTRDCFFGLVPFCYFIFSAICMFKHTKVRSAELLRHLSTLIYVMHYSVLIAVRKIMRHMGYYHALMIFVISLITVLFISLLIINLSNYKRFRCFRYLY